MRKIKFLFLLANIFILSIFLFSSLFYLNPSSCKHINQINWLIEPNSRAARMFREQPTNYDVIDFEGFDNNKKNDPDMDFNTHILIVPNIVHLIYLNRTEIEFYQYVNIFSIFLNQKPDKIFIHCDNCNFDGFYWRHLNSVEELRKILVLNKVSQHKTIFGQRVRWIQHRSDILRILVLMNYGGIYLDNDVYVINSLDKYRVYEMTVSWKKDESTIGNQVLIGNRNSRFLRAYFDSYRTNFTSKLWYHNAGAVPAQILSRYPYLAHIEPVRLGTHMLVHRLYKAYWTEWRHELDSVHLLINHRSYLDKNSPIKVFDHVNIQIYNYTYGEMCREILDRIRPFMS